MKRLFTATLIFSLALAACNGIVGRGDGDDNRFSAFADIPDEEWLYDAPLEFVPENLMDSISPDGTLLVSVRHSRQYPYRNLWLEISYADTDSTRHADTLNVELADASGKHLGRGMGLSVELLDTVAPHYVLERGRALRVRHIMRVDTLTGIERIGVVYVP